MKDWTKLLVDAAGMTGTSKKIGLAHNELVRSIYDPPKKAPAKKAPAKKK